jgi:hypothetical protein
VTSSDACGGPGVVRDEVFRLHSDDAFRGLLWEDEAQSLVWRGAPLGDVRELRVRPDGSDRPWGDFPGLADSICVFSERGRDALAGFVDGLGEWVDVVGADRPLFAFNVTHVIDVLDRERSMVITNQRGEVTGIERWRFKAWFYDEEGPPIFKIPEVPIILAKWSLRFRVAEHRLLGLRFEGLY